MQGKPLFGYYGQFGFDELTENNLNILFVEKKDFSDAKKLMGLGSTARGISVLLRKTRRDFVS
jgi:hypothetical protein